MMHSVPSSLPLRTSPNPLSTFMMYAQFKAVANREVTIGLLVWDVDGDTWSRCCGTTGIFITLRKEGGGLQFTRVVALLLFC